MPQGRPCIRRIHGEDEVAAHQLARDQQVLQSLLQVGVGLSAVPDRQKLLEMILCEARTLTRAEAGSLYVLDRDCLKFVATQNDKVGTPENTRHLLGKEIPLTCDSLAGFVGFSKEPKNIANSYELPSGAPFRVNRDFEAATGYRSESILGIPLKCPDGQCIGVLELVNRIDESGVTVAFPEDDCGGILSLASMAAVTIQNAQLQEQLKQAHLDTIIRLSAAAEFRDDDTADHVHRISHVSSLVAKAMDLPPGQVELIEWASPMHDIGKIGIPDSVLTKRGPLTPQERRVSEKHTMIGAEILANPKNDLHRVAREIALTHHERWDGSGYPRKLKGTDIPIEGRIVALADVFDSLVSKRCYKEPYPIDVGAYIIRRQEDRGFDPAVLEAFFRNFDEIVVPYAVLPHCSPVQL